MLAQFAERFALNLANPFAGQAQLLANFLQCERLIAIHTEAKSQHGGFPFVHAVQKNHDVPKAIGFNHFVVWSLCCGIHQHFVKRPASVALIGLWDSVVDLDGFLDDGQFLARQIEGAAHFFLAGSTPQLFLKLGAGPAPFGKQFNHISGNTDRFGRIYQCPLDRLLDPVAGISAEARVHCRVEAFDSAQQS